MGNEIPPPCKHSSGMNPYRCDPCGEIADLTSRLDKALAEVERMKDAYVVSQDRAHYAELQVREEGERCARIVRDHVCQRCDEKRLASCFEEVERAILGNTQKPKDVLAAIPGTGAHSGTGTHYYPGAQGGQFFTSDCANGCGCWMGSSRSGGPDGVDPFGKCPAVVEKRVEQPPKNADELETKKFTRDRDCTCGMKTFMRSLHMVGCPVRH